LKHGEDQPLSDHRKGKRNIISNRKGFSSIVGAVFAILVIVSLAGTFFVWSIQQNTMYVDAVRGVDELTLNRQSESLNITSNPIYAAVGSSVNVFTGVQNDGPITVNITTLWLQDVNGTRPYGYKPLNMLLRPGDFQPLNENVEISGLNLDDNFTGWLITQRGNVIPLFPAHAKGDQGVTGAIGPQGATGAAGTNGAAWHVGTSDPSAVLGVNGDFYFNTATDDVYQKVSGSWALIGSLRGQQGTPGIDGVNGTNGTNWYVGEGIPPSDLGGTGDWYFSNNTNYVYNKLATGWQYIANLTGQTGSTSYDANTALISQGIGSIAMNFKSFLVYTVDAQQRLVSPSPAYTFAIGQNLAFSLNVTNMDPTGGVMNLTQLSCLWIFSPASGAIKGQQWPLAMVSGNVITTLGAGQSVSLYYNQSTRIYFGPSVATTNNLNQGISGVNLIVIGKVGSQDYGQNLPFISLIIT
jgi:flagellin-like protein